MTRANIFRADLLFFSTVVDPSELFVVVLVVLDDGLDVVVEFLDQRQAQDDYDRSEVCDDQSHL